MITVRMFREPDRTINGFHVDGHANFADAGNDIVCAGVSALTVGTVNAIEQLLGVVAKANMDKGKLHVDVPRHQDEEVNKQVQLLLEAMIVMIGTIQNSYGKYVDLQDK